MTTTKVTMGGRDYMLVPEEAYNDMVARLGAKLPPMPPRNQRGNRPAKEAVRVMIARSIIRDRVAAGWTQEDLAKRAKVSIETISRLEGGKHKPQAATIEKIDAAFRKRKAAT